MIYNSRSLGSGFLMPIFKKGGDFMATIQQSIAITDGVTPQLQRMARAAEVTTGRFERTASAANQIENSVSQTAATQVGNLGTAAFSAANGFSAATSPANNLKNTVGGMVGDFGRLQEVVSGTFAKLTLASVIVMGLTQIIALISTATNKLISLSDEYSGIVARINLITSSAADAAAMNDQIYYSALRARGSYSGMADAVSKIGLTAKDAFPDPQAIVPFVENIQKLFTVGGTGLEQQKDAMLQLTQALGSGKLQGDEFRSIAEAAPMIEQIVAHFMGVTQGELKQLSSQGAITAEIMKNAILGATDEINAKFSSMPMTWGQIWQNMQTVAFRAFVPVFNQLSAIANSDSMKQFGENTSRVFLLAGQAVSGFINNVQWMSGVVSANSGMIAPVFAGIGIALLGLSINAGYAATMAIAHGVAATYETGALIALMLAQEGVNATLTACPISWIIAGVAAIVSVFYLAAEAVSAASGGSVSSMDVISAALEWIGSLAISFFSLYIAGWVAMEAPIAAAAIAHGVLAVWQGIVTAYTWAQAAAIAVQNAELMVAYIRMGIVTGATALWAMVTTGVTGVLRILNLTLLMNPIGIVIALVLGAIAVFGAWAIHTMGLRNAIASAFGSIAETAANAINFMIGKVNGLIGLLNKASGAINNVFGTHIGVVGTIDWRADAGGWKKGASEFVQDFDIHKIFSLPDMPKAPEAPSGFGGASMGDIGQNTKATADNSGKIKDAMDITDEDIKYLRDIAEQEAINKYTTAEVKIEMGGIHNTVNSDTDIDGMMRYINDSLIGGMQAGAEKVHP